VPEVVLTALADDWLGLPRPELGRALTLLQQQQFVEEEWSAAGRAWQFSHALTQEAIYESLLLARRRRLHGLVGAVIERLYGATEASELHRGPPARAGEGDPLPEARRRPRRPARGDG
jgi:predicted ATPase